MDIQLPHPHPVLMLVSRPVFIFHPPCVPMFPVYMPTPTVSRMPPMPSFNTNFQLQLHDEEDADQGVHKKLIIRWEPPCPGFFKLNTDGSSKGNPGPSSYGGLIRDQYGRWVCGYMGKMSKNVVSLVAELCAIYRGFCVIKRKGIRNVIVETDCQAALLLITVKTVDEKHPQKKFIEFCKLVMKECNCFMIHTRREGNHCADQIAKLGGSQSMTYIELVHPPKCLTPFLFADAARIGYERPSRKKT